MKVHGLWELVQPVKCASSRILFGHSALLLPYVHDISASAPASQQRKIALTTGQSPHGLGRIPSVHGEQGGRAAENNGQTD